MEGIITLIIIGFILTFGSQLLKGIGNIFAASGRIGGWIVGIILVLFLLKTLVFSPTTESVTPPNNTETKLLTNEDF